VNDLVAGGGKLGGILTEATATGTDLGTVIVGIGVNTRRAARDLPLDALPATNLEDLVPDDRIRDAQIDALAAAIAKQVSANVRRIAEGDAAWVRDAWERHRQPAAPWPA
jgi:biotin-(acetyl-CoA carboxylase) ligase